MRRTRAADAVGDTLQRPSGQGIIKQIGGVSIACPAHGKRGKKMSQLTKKAITEAFITLLNQRPLDKITVKDIVDRCQINRNTFYYHYQDIYALLEELMQEEIRKIVENAPSIESWQDGFIEGIQFALSNRKAVYHVYNSAYRELLAQYLFRVADRILPEFVGAKSQGLDVSPRDMRIICDFYKYALAGIVFQWIRGGMQEELTEVIRRIGVLFEGNIRSALVNGAEHPQ